MLHLFLSAGPLDFTPRPVGTSADAVLVFNNLNRRRCFDVQITPDDLFEEDEMFLLDSIPYTAGSTRLELIPQAADVTILDAQPLCYTDSDQCSNAISEPVSLSIEVCCLGSGLSFSDVDGNTCHLCVGT